MGIGIASAGTVESRAARKKGESGCAGWCVLFTHSLLLLCASFSYFLSNGSFHFIQYAYIHTSVFLSFFLSLCVAVFPLVRAKCAWVCIE